MRSNKASLTNDLIRVQAGRLYDDLCRSDNTPSNPTCSVDSFLPEMSVAGSRVKIAGGRDSGAAGRCPIGTKADAQVGCCRCG